jgi:NADH-quinone oxidoreductase subunit A
MFILTTNGALCSNITSGLLASVHAQLFANFAVFAILVVLLCAVLATLAYLLSLSSAQDTEKRSEYECGFAPFDSATRLPFDVHFYLVGILFLIFDVEVALLFPWIVSIDSTGRFGFFMVMQFVVLLSVGFLYEWMRGALIWPSKYSAIRTKLSSNGVSLVVMALALTDGVAPELAFCLPLWVGVSCLKAPTKRAFSEIANKVTPPKKVRRARTPVKRSPRELLALTPRNYRRYIFPRWWYYLLTAIRTYIPVMWAFAIFLATLDMLFDLVFLGYEVVWEATVKVYRRIGDALTYLCPWLKEHHVLLVTLQLLLLYPAGVVHYFSVKEEFLGTLPLVDDWFWTYNNAIVYPIASFCFTFFFFHAQQGRVLMWWYSNKVLGSGFPKLYERLKKEEAARSLPYRLRHPDKGYKDLVFIALLYRPGGAFATYHGKRWAEMNWTELKWQHIDWPEFLTFLFEAFYDFNADAYYQHIFPGVTSSFAMMSFAAIYIQFYMRVYYKRPVKWLRLLLSCITCVCSVTLFVLYKQWEYRNFPMVDYSLQDFCWEIFYYSVPMWIWQVLLALFVTWRVVKFYRSWHYREVLRHRYWLRKRWRRFHEALAKIAEDDEDPLENKDVAAQRRAAHIAKCEAAAPFDKTVLLKHPSAIPDSLPPEPTLEELQAKQKK